VSTDLEISLCTGVPMACVVGTMSMELSYRSCSTAFSQLFKSIDGWFVVMENVMGPSANWNQQRVGGLLTHVGYDWIVCG
jgi:hypothetical protein